MSDNPTNGVSPALVDLSSIPGPFVVLAHAAYLVFVVIVADGMVSARRVVDLPADTVLVYYLAASGRAAHLIEGRTR